MRQGRSVPGQPRQRLHPMTRARAFCCGAVPAWCISESPHRIVHLVVQSVAATLSEPLMTDLAFSQPEHRGTRAPDPMSAAVLDSIPSEFLAVRSVPGPARPQPGEALLEVAACGICGTDLHILAGHSYRPDTPFVLGHEPVGRVVAVGSHEDEAWIGKRATITLFTGCGTCTVCTSGDERLCPRLRSITGVWQAWGGYADRLRVWVDQLVPVPDALSDTAVASLVDCGATAANAVRVALERSPSFAVVAGAGPIGFLVAELLRRREVALQVVQPSPTRRAALQRLGHAVVATFDEVSGVPDVVIDCAAAEEVVHWAVSHLGPRGLYIAAGYTVVDRLELPLVARKELDLKGVRSGSKADLDGIMQLAATGDIHLPEVAVWSLSHINDALRALRAKQVPGKAVIVPSARTDGSGASG